MSVQADAVTEVKLVKSDSGTNKLPKAAEKEKAPKAKPQKTLFAGRLDEILFAADGVCTIVVKDKRGKSHDFKMSSSHAASPFVGGVLAAALAQKHKLHVNVTPDNPKLVANLSVQAKK